MKKYLFTGFFIFIFTNYVTAQDFSIAGPYPAGWREVIVSRSDNSTFEALVYYPAQSPAQDAPVNNQAAICPGISFGHAFLVRPDKYRSTFAHLASWGYVLIAPRSEGGLFPNHLDFAEDLSHSLTWLIEQTQNQNSLFYKFININELALSGHSMGAGASILAAANDTRVKTVVNMAAAETNPSAVDAMENIDVPVTLIAGSDDSIVPVGSHGQLIYNNGFAPKQLLIIDGGYHCGFMDSNILFCDSGTISRSQQLAITKYLLTVFFQMHLKNDHSLWSQTWGPSIMNDNRWSVQIETCTPGDFDVDCCVKIFDLHGFLIYWQQYPCSHPEWCSGRDFNQDQWVDLSDLAIISQTWLDCY